MMNWRNIIKEAVKVVLVAALLAGASYLIRPMLMDSPIGDSSADATDESKGAIHAVTLDEARSHFEQGTALFADARSLNAYQAGHIRGAMHLDPNEFDAWSEDFFMRIAPEQPIIAYCDGPRCALSLDLAEKLTWMGYEKVSHLKNGWGLWKENQLPVEQNTQ